MPAAASAEQMRRSMSAGQMIRVSSASILNAGKETAKTVTKSVVVAKAAEIAVRRSGAAAAASAAGLAAWGASLAVARRIHPDYLDPVSSNQIIRDPEFCMNCHLLMVTDDSVRLEDIRSSFEFYVKHFPRFSQRVVVRQLLWPYWELVDRIQWEQHIFVDPTELDHESMQDVVSRSLTQGMNPLYPLWKLTHFPNYTHDDGTRGSAMLLKFHHCMGDGYSFASAFMTGVDAPPPVERPPRSLPERAHQPGQIGKFFGATAKLLAAKDDPPSTIKAKNLLKAHDDRHAVWRVAQTSVEAVKRFSKANECTLNDVVLGAIAGALRSFRLRKGEATTEDPLSVIWVALRPIAEALEPKDPSMVDQPGNKTLGAVLLKLPVAQDCSGADRCKAVAQRVDEMKGSPEPLLAQKLTGLFGMMPMVLSNKIWDTVSNKVSLSISNVPGPKFDMKWAGATIRDAQVWVPPVGTISTFVLVTTYRDRISLNLGVDGAVFSKDDARFIAKAFDEELSLITGANPSSSL